MLPVARILIFIVLSMTLHFWGLSYNFKLLAEPIENQQIGVGYVSRSLASFVPVIKPAVQKSEKINDLLSKKQQIARSGKVTTDVPIVRVKQATVIQKPLQSVADVIPVKSLDQPELVKPNTIDDVKLEKTSPATSIAKMELPEQQVETSMQTQPPLQLVANAETSVKNELLKQSSSGQLDDRLTDPGQFVALSTTADNDKNSGFRTAVPRYDNNPAPAYPEVARRRGWQGTVQFEVLVLKSGRVGGLDMVVSTGYRSLDNAARKSINRWKFVPATAFGVPVDSRVVVPVNFVLGIR
ncbi:MAG: TonB family protein [Desulfuromusa sp.]|nr:TonB family protein [Desulfuromusa sp.]